MQYACRAASVLITQYERISFKVRMQSESEAGARLHGKRRGPADGDLKRQTRLYQSAGRDEQLAAGQRDPRGARRVRGQHSRRIRTRHPCAYAGDAE